jgi:hypothetical protein
MATDILIDGTVFTVAEDYDAVVSALNDLSIPGREPPFVIELTFEGKRIMVSIQYVAAVMESE